MEVSSEVPAKKRRVQPSRRAKDPLVSHPAKNPTKTPAKEASSRTSSGELNDDGIPEWAQVLDSVRSPRVNYGSRIRRCVEESLEKNPTKTPAKGAPSCTESVEVNDDVIPEWARVLEPVRNLRVNCGSRIRRCVEESLEKNPPERVKEILEQSISKEVYKSNASGPTKRAVIALLENSMKSPAKEKKNASSCLAAVDVNEDAMPEWAQVLKPVRNLRVNVGSRIRKCVEESLEKNPPDWAKKILEQSISTEFYKGNAAGPTKRAVIALLENLTCQNPTLNAKENENVNIQTNFLPEETPPARTPAGAANSPSSAPPFIVSLPVGAQASVTATTTADISSILRITPGPSQTLVMSTARAVPSPIILRDQTTPPTSPIADLPVDESDKTDSRKELAFMKSRVQELEHELERSEARRANSDFRNFRALEAVEALERKLVNLQSDTDRRVDEIRREAAEAIQRLR